MLRGKKKLVHVWQGTGAGAAGIATTAASHRRGGSGWAFRAHCEDGHLLAQLAAVTLRAFCLLISVNQSLERMVTGLAKILENRHKVLRRRASNYSSI